MCKGPKFADSRKIEGKACCNEDDGTLQLNSERKGECAKT